MKVAEIADWWRNINSFKKYRVKLTKIKFSSVPYFDDFELPLEASVSFLTGRNGIGKTSFMKLICEMINNEESSISYISNEDRKGISITINVNGNDIEINDEQNVELPVNVEYFDASSFSEYVLDSIKVNPDKTWSKESEPRELSEEDIEVIKKVTGKRYDSISIEEARPEDRDYVVTRIIPLFTVKLGDISYTNENMGTGEHKALILIWKLLTTEDNSILFIEEPESFICPNYQTKLVNFLAWYASSKKLNIIISTHSEHILSAQQSNSNFIFQKTGINRFKLVPENSESRYLSVLGLKPRINKLLLVEDDFAKLFLRRILNCFDLDYSSTTSIRKLSGESGLKAILANLHNGEDIKVLGVLDADMLGSNLGITPRLDYTFLPSISNNAPEQEIIKYLEQNTEKLADALNITQQNLDAVLDDHIEDHHDWFIELSRKLTTHHTLSDLKLKCIQIWIDNHIALCKEFVFELRNLGSSFNAKLVFNDPDYFAQTSCGINFKITNPLRDMPDIGEKINAKLSYNALCQRELAFTK